MDDRRTTPPREPAPGRSREALDAWMRWEPTGRHGALSAFLLTPARVIVGLGAAAALVGGFMPWAEGRAPGWTGMEPVFFSGLGGAGDGLLMIILAGATGFLTLHRTPAESRIRTVRLLPGLLVVMAAVTWANGHRAALGQIDAWVRRGGHGDIAIGLWVVAAGVLLMAAGTLWLLPPALRWRAAEGDPGDLVTLRVRDVLVVGASLVGVFVGAAAGIGVGLELTGPQIIGTLAFGAVFGGMFGAYAGAWAMRSGLDAVEARRRG